MAEEVVPATTVVKVVLLMLEVVLVDPDTALDKTAITNKEHKEVLSVKAQLNHQWLKLKATSKDVVKEEELTVETVASRSHTMVKALCL